MVGTSGVGCGLQFLDVKMHKVDFVKWFDKKGQFPGAFNNICSECPCLIRAPQEMDTFQKYLDVHNVFNKHVNLKKNHYLFFKKQFGILLKKEIGIAKTLILELFLN